MFLCTPDARLTAAVDRWAANSFTHSAVSLGLGENASVALEPSLRLLANIRDRLRDFWDWVDYTAGPGQASAASSLSVLHR